MNKIRCILFGHRYIWVWNHIECCRICGDEKVHYGKVNKIMGGIKK